MPRYGTCSMYRILWMKIHKNNELHTMRRVHVWLVGLLPGSQGFLKLSWTGEVCMTAYLILQVVSCKEHSLEGVPARRTLLHGRQVLSCFPIRIDSTEGVQNGTRSLCRSKDPRKSTLACLGHMAGSKVSYKTRLA